MQMHGSFLSPAFIKRLSNLLVQLLFSLAAALVLFIPGFNETLLIRGDTVEVLNRIEAIAMAMNSRQAVHAPMSRLNFGYGYGSTLFESPFPYYIPALFRHFGMDLQVSFLTCIYILFACMVFASYGMAQTILKKDRMAVFVTALLSSGSLCACIMIFCDGRIADGTALIFVPVIIGAIYEMFRTKGGGWIRLTLAMSLCLLSSGVYGKFTILLVLVYFLVHFRWLRAHRRVILLLALSLLITAALTVWVWLPPTVLSAEGSYVIDSIHSLETPGAGIQDLLDVVPYSADHMGKTVGLILLGLPALIFRRKGGTRWKFASECTIAGYGVLFMTTNMFPWSLFSFAARIADPSRLMPVSAVLLSVGAGCVLSWYPFDQNDRPFIRRCIAGITAVLILMMVNTRYHCIGGITRDFTVKELSDDARMFGSTDSFENRSETGNGWYLPVTDYNYRGKKRVVIKENETLSFVETDGVLITDGRGKGTYLFPKTWYPGYALTVREEGKKKEVIRTEQDPGTGLVKAVIENEVPEGAKLELRYEKPAILQVTESLSILFWTAFGLAGILVPAWRWGLFSGTKNIRMKPGGNQ